MVDLPEGYEMSLHAYLISDSLRAIGVVTLRAPAKLVIPEQGNPQALAKSVNAPDAPDWRFMTREEIADYKAEESA